MSVKKSETPGRNFSSGKSRGQKSVTPITGGTSKTPSGHLPVRQMHPGLEDEIRFRAYVLFEERGRQHGLDVEDWIQAEEEILSRYQKEKSA